MAAKCISGGGRTFIITGPSKEKALTELKDFADKYNDGYQFWTEVYSIVDYIKENDIPHFEDEKGHVWALKDQDWNSVKGKLAIELGLDLHIDDTEEYGEYFPPGVFLHLKNKDKKDVRANVLVS